MESPDVNLNDAMDRLNKKPTKPSMSKEEAIKIIKETGDYLYKHMGTDSYEQRCKLYDARDALEFEL